MVIDSPSYFSYLIHRIDKIDMTEDVISFYYDYFS